MLCPSLHCNISVEDVPVRFIFSLPVNHPYSIPEGNTKSLSETIDLHKVLISVIVDYPKKRFFQFYNYYPKSD